MGLVVAASTSLSTSRSSIHIGGGSAGCCHLRLKLRHPRLQLCVSGLYVLNLQFVDELRVGQVLQACSLCVDDGLLGVHLTPQAGNVIIAPLNGRLLALHLALQLTNVAIAALDGGILGLQVLAQVTDGGVSALELGAVLEVGWVKGERG